MTFTILKFTLKYLKISCIIGFYMNYQIFFMQLNEKHNLSASIFKIIIKSTYHSMININSYLIITQIENFI